MHVPKEKWRKLDAKAEKCILVGYSDEQKGYKCYNPRTKQARVSRDVVFDESASWYLPPTTDLNSNTSSDDEVSKAEMPLVRESDFVLVKWTEWTTESVRPVQRVSNTNV